MSDTGELKSKMEKVDRSMRDQPARRLITAGVVLLGISAVGGGAIIAEPWLDRINPACMTLGLLGGLFLAAGYVMREIRTGQDSLREEIRDARVAETMVLGRLASLLEPLRKVISALPGAVKEAYREEISDLSAVIEAGLRANAKAYEDGLVMIKAEVDTLKDLQGDLERDLAAVIISRQPDSQKNGIGRSAANLRALRPDEMG